MSLFCSLIYSDQSRKSSDLEAISHVGSPINGCLWTRFVTEANVRQFGNKIRLGEDFAGTLVERGASGEI